MTDLTAELLTTDELAAVMKVSRSTIYRWLAAGRIRAGQVMPRGRWYFPQSEVERLKDGLKRRRPKSTKRAGC